MHQDPSGATLRGITQQPGGRGVAYGSGFRTLTWARDAGGYSVSEGTTDATEAGQWTSAVQPATGETWLGGYFFDGGTYRARVVTSAADGGWLDASPSLSVVEAVWADENGVWAVGDRKVLRRQASAAWNPEWAPGTMDGYLRAMHGHATSDVYAVVGDHGTVLRRAGGSWEALAGLERADALQDVTVSPDGTTVYAVGYHEGTDSGVVLTSLADGGFSRRVTPERLLGATTTPGTAWGVGAAGTTLNLDTLVGPSSFGALTVRAADTGTDGVLVVVGDNGLLAAQRPDGGFEQGLCFALPPNVAFNAVDAVTQDDVWTAGALPDAGALLVHWKNVSCAAITLPSDAPELLGIARVDGGGVWAVGRQGRVLYVAPSSMSGATFAGPVTDDLTSIAVDETQAVWVTARRKPCNEPIYDGTNVYRLRNGTWQPFTTPAAKELLRVRATPDGTLWAVGCDSTVLQLRP